MRTPRLTTAVIGAGPAGLLFAALGRILFEKTGIKPEAWALRVYDKREAYARTHRLRMAPEAYFAIQRDVADPRFDAFVDFLAESDFTPEVNVLEEHLLALALAVGCRKELLVFGDAPGEVTLPGLRARLEKEGLLGSDTTFTIVAADSVHSVVREWVRGQKQPMRHTHERIARIRVDGADLPRRLTATDQVRLSKVLGSIIDYRLNRNGYAEVDLFVTAREFELVRHLGASPKNPVALDSTTLGKLRAPLFRAIVLHLERAPSAARREHAERREVLLQSTFTLEHAVMPTLMFERKDVGAHVFLLGDAGISLPFQRGMSCLGQCAHNLARIHRDWLAAEEPAHRAALFSRYDPEAETVKQREIAIVRSRARLFHALREIVRVSALLPFPIQSWWLRASETLKPSDRLSIWFWLNVGLAVAALSVALVGTANGSGFAWASLALEFLGGVAYHAALAFEGGPHRLVRRVWEVQIALAFLAGGALTAWTSSAAGRFVLGPAPFWWLLLAAAFVIGLYAFERFVTRWFAAAGLSFDDGDALDEEVKGPAAKADASARQGV